MKNIVPFLGNLDWTFRTYNIESKINKQKISDAYEKEFHEKFNFSKLNYKYLNGQSLDRKKIDNLFMQFGDVNTNSLILFSYVQSVISSKCYYWLNNDLSKAKEDENDIQGINENVTGAKAGFLFIGDYDAYHNFDNINTIANELKCWAYIGGIQIPHHGSNNNFNSEIIKKAEYCIISANPKFIFEHPHEQVRNCVKEIPSALINNYTLRIYSSLSKSLFSQIESSELKKYPLLSCCMRDGVLFPTAYESSVLKIAFILKEPYAEWDEATNSPADCDFDFFDIVKNLKYHYGHDLNKTWLKVSAIAYALKNKAEYTESLSYEQVVEGLSCVAWINLSKTPWRTTTKIDAAYKERVKTWEPVIKQQLSQITPDIVFYGNIWELSYINPIEPDVPWQDEFTTNLRKYEYKSEKGKTFRISILKYRNTNKILVNGYHPELGNSAKWQTEFIKNYIKK